MEKLTEKQYKSLVEAYIAVYDEDLKDKLNEEQQINEFLEVVNSLVEEGYDLSEYTYDELYESYLNEGGGGIRGSVVNLLKNPKFWKNTGIAALANYADEKILKGAGKRLVGDVLNTNLQSIQGQPSIPSASPKPAEPTPTKPKKPESLPGFESFDSFDLIKGHLLDEGYADTEKAALAIMSNMSEEWRQSIVEMNDFEAGGGNAKMKKTGMDRASVEKLGANNLAKAPKSSSSSSGGGSSGGSFSPGRYDINVNFGKPPAPQDSSNDARILSKLDALRQKKFGPDDGTAQSIFRKPGYDVPSFADTSDDLMRSQAQDHDAWLVAKGRQKPGYRGTQDIADRTIAKQRAYYGQK